MEQLCSLCNWNSGDCRDRVAMDGAEARTNGRRARGQSPPSRQDRGKGGATSRSGLIRKDGPAPKGGYDAADNVSLVPSRYSLRASTYISTVARISPWYPPLQTTQGWGTPGRGGTKEKSKGGPPAP